MSQSIDRKIVTFVLLCLLLLFTVIILFYFGIPEFDKLKMIINRHPKADSRTMESKSENELSQFWKNVNLKKDEIPVDLIKNSEQISVSSKTITIENGEVFYLESNPESAHSTISILLLHGMAFSSKTWLDLGTIKMLAAFGYRTVAIDIPGFGKSSKNDIKNRDQYLRSIINELKLHKPVIISPSYSGYFTLPFVLKHWNEISGFVPIAPVGYNALQQYKCVDNTNSIIPQLPDKLKIHLKEPIPNLSCVKVPSMVVYGEHDQSPGMITTALLSLLPYSQLIEIPKGNHPAYLDDPKLWHQLLYNFLKHIK